MRKRWSARSSATQRVRKPAASARPNITSNAPFSMTRVCAGAKAAVQVGTHAIHSAGAAICESPNHRKSATSPPRRSTWPKSCLGIRALYRVGKAFESDDIGSLAQRNIVFARGLVNGLCRRIHLLFQLCKHILLGPSFIVHVLIPLKVGNRYTARICQY